MVAQGTTRKLCWSLVLALCFSIAMADPHGHHPHPPPPDQPCDITIAYFFKDILTEIAESEGFLKREGINKYCGVQIFGSIPGFEMLLNGSVDAFHTTFDTVYSRRISTNPPILVSVAAGLDLGAGMVILGHSSLTSLSQLNNSVYAADAPTAGFITLAYEATRLSGVELSTVANVSGFSDDERLSLVNGDTVRGAQANWGAFVRLRGLPQYYEPTWPNVHLLASMEDYIWPVQGSVFCVKNTAQDSSSFRTRLTKYFRALLRSFDFATRRVNKRRVIRIISQKEGIPLDQAEGIYATTIGNLDELTGLCPQLLPNTHGLFNVGVSRFNQGIGPAPGTVDFTDQAGGLVDLRALSAV